jgi:hypothetical protein
MHSILHFSRGASAVFFHAVGLTSLADHYACAALGLAAGVSGPVTGRVSAAPTVVPCSIPVRGGANQGFGRAI